MLVTRNRNRYVILKEKPIEKCANNVWGQQSLGLSNFDG